ncbi:MAG TPA: hypothetical protein EYN46_04050 [Candidatus Poseidoniales archaeon]|nr:hypothetical protein [Candidatus Poseidoniales archaeon]
MRWRIVLFASATVFALLTATILVMRNPAPPPPPETVNSSDWLNSNTTENLSAFLVPKDKTDFDWENMSDGATWRIGDKWLYDGRLDASSVIDDAEIPDARIDDLLRGNALLEVTNISWMEWEGEQSLTYVVELAGSFSGPAIFPVPLIETLAGDLLVEYHATEYIRVSDHATHRLVESLTLDFEYDYEIGIGLEPIADLYIVTNNSPAIEWWDFPLAINETWLSEVEETKTYTGTSDYVELPEEDEVEDVYRRLVATEQGQGKDTHPDCVDATNVTAFDKENKISSWRWYCPDIGTWSWRVGEVPLGVTGDFRLLEYIPAETRALSPTLTIELSPPATNKSTIIEIWINASQGNASVAEISGEIIYGCCTSIAFSTAINGSAWLELNVSNRIDDTSTFDDLASHGIIAIVSNSDQMAMASITLYGSVLGEQVRNTGGQWQWSPLDVSVHNAAIISSVIRW